jgi:ketosteroid isomerase-like protein
MMETDGLNHAAVAVLEQLVDVTRAEEFLDSLHDDVTWTIPGSWPGISGTKDRRQIEDFVRRLFPAGFPHGIAVDIRAAHEVGPTAIIEFIGTARTSRDRHYENSYCFVFEFSNGKVAAIREYMDTLYADGVLHQ